MDNGQIAIAPYFDVSALKNELTALVTEKGGNADAARLDILARLKTLVKTGRAAARVQLNADGNGRRCAEGLSKFQDALIQLIYEFTIAHVYRADNPSDSERMAVVATGGYGRGLLAPGSDIDLLFLLPYKQTAWGESVVEYVLYMLWDLNFKVGHATRNVIQCMRFAKADMTIRTALLDSRLILGDEKLFAELETRFAADVVRGSARAFIAAKLAERDERHIHSGESRYRVEPNIKDGKGGLRDLHTLHWLAKYVHGEVPGAVAMEVGVFDAEEYHTYRKCDDFLWTVRCHLHFLTGRAEERLTFDVQENMAERLGYTSHGGLRAVERFMKHYFLIAKDVGDLTRILCSALEMQLLSIAPSLNTLLSPQSWRMRRRLRAMTDFRIDNGRINVADADAFSRDPVNLLRLFAYTEHYNVMIHPDSIRRLRHSIRLIDDDVRNNKEANRVFLDMLTSKANPELALRLMNEAGVLGRFIPDFGRIVAMMQFNMYHHYTVDEHLLRTVGKLSEIEAGLTVELHPLSFKIFPSIQNRRALYVAAFLHDIAKGRDEDHSIAGARIVRELGPRFGLTASETEIASWLIEHHLVMSTYAQTRDLGDPKTIRDFANVVQSLERLKLLLVLTVADICAVGPGVWNGWKGQLMRTLYFEVEPILTGGHSQIGRSERIATAKDELRGALSHWPSEDLDRFIARHYDSYWLRTDTPKQIEHAQLMRTLDQTGDTLTTAFASDAFTGITELTILAPNHARTLALIAGSCAAAGANIIGAHISTTRDGMALDTFQLQRDFDRDEDEKRRADRIGTSISELLRGKVRLSKLMAGKEEHKGRIQAFSVAPEIIINNDMSDRLTVIEVSGLDRPGLLYDLTQTIADLNLDVNSAHVTTFGAKAVDVFYVTDLTGRKITDPSRQNSIRRRISDVLTPADTETATATA